MTPPPSSTGKTWNVKNFGPVGIGINLIRPGMTMQIANVEKGSPAEKTGKLKKGQIIESINATPLGSHRQINMALNPAGLGRVMIKFQQVGEEILGTLQVEKLQTRNDIQEALPEIMASMNQHGVAVKEINVVMNQNHNQQQQTSQSHDEQVADFNNQKQLFGQQGQQDGQEKKEPSESMEERQEYSQPTKTVSQISDEAINVYM